MNVTHFIGRIGRDPEAFGQNGIGAKTSLAIDDYNPTTKQRETLWVNIAAFGKTAETMMKYALKGRMVRVSCRYQVREYEKNGEKRWDHSFIVNDLELLPDGSGKQQQAAAAPSAEPIW